MMTPIPRPEYPRPQFARENWLCLNGEWQFEIDQGDSGLERGLLDRELKDRVNVPFCPESPLSGIHNTDFLNAVWYRRQVTVPNAWAGRRVLLHFQAVDYDATVWVNGREVARHRGGFTPFSCDLYGVAAAGESLTIIVRARDYRCGPQPRGKQSVTFDNAGVLYTRTTGIWQTVWLEPVPQTYLGRARLTPDLANGLLRLEQPITGDRSSLRLRARLRDAQGEVCVAEGAAGDDFCPRLDLAIPAERRRSWSPRDPHLYDLDLVLLNADRAVVDHLASYAGLRAITIDGRSVKLNGETLFQRLVLDQGYYPDGILTAPSDDALQRDIELSQAAGFNGARLHQKVFEERFLYHADRRGYLVWGEFPDWGSRQGDGEHEPGPAYITEWLEALERDYAHPSLVGWCPLNETWQPISDRIQTLDDVTRGMFLAAKAMDLTRPVLDASGYSHRVAQTDVYDSHDYDQSPETFRQRHARLKDGQPYINASPDEKRRAISLDYRGQPYFVSEFGGMLWNSDAHPGDDAWGYGDGPRSLEEFYARFEGLCGALLDNPAMFGYCYTQLTDVYQEKNGLYTFDRRAKFDLARLRRIQQRPAAIEQTNLP